MTNTKIKSINDLSMIVKKLRGEGKTVALITGCFDVVHLGHLRLFEFAKSKADYVVIGLDSDESIMLTKGVDRPLNKLKYRIEYLTKLYDVDYVFEITDKFNFGSNDSNYYLDAITEILNPNFLVTNSVADKYWKDKKLRANRLGVKLLLDSSSRCSSSSEVIRKIESEL